MELATAGFGSSESGRLRRSLRASRPEGQEPFHVLAGGGHQGLGVHLLQPPEPEPPRPVPPLGLRKERLDPHRAFAQGLAVGLGVAVRPHPLQILLLEAAAHPAPLRTVRAFALEGTGVAGGRLGCVPNVPSPVVVALTTQDLASGAGVDVPFGVVGEGVYGEEGGAFPLLGQRDVGADARPLYGRYVLPRAVGRVPRYRAQAQAPPKAAPEQ